MKPRSFAVLVIFGACAPAPAGNEYDSLPLLTSDAVPFRYPLELYQQRVQGDVTLRLHVDSSGVVVPESLRIVESSGQPSLDTAAMAGATALQFRPARLRGRAVPLTVLFPVKFRVPAQPGGSDTSGRLQDR
ncbi:MAG: energy transducer TonB [Gemmatimonadota bacterium]